MKVEQRTQRLVPLRFHHVRILEIISENMQEAGQPIDPKGRRIPLQELYRYPLQALDLALTHSQSHTDGLLKCYRSLASSSGDIEHIVDKIGVECNNSADYTERFAGVLKFLLAVPPTATAAISNKLM